MQHEKKQLVKMRYFVCLSALDCNYITLNCKGVFQSYFVPFYKGTLMSIYNIRTNEIYTNGCMYVCK